MSASRSSNDRGSGRASGDRAGTDPRSAHRCADLARLDDAVSGCRACPRLVAWREQVAVTKRAAYADQTYWGRPVPGFGAPDARIAILGLAPAAHGGNRTGRIFTGDRSGDVLFAALHRVGLANQALSASVDDGLALAGVRIFSAVRCAPPDNKPTPAERDTCAPWLRREIELIRPTLRVVVALGAFAWSTWWPAMSAVYQVASPRPLPRFGHGMVVPGEAGVPPVIGCYHVSQQNTFTGRLTPAMLDVVLTRAIDLASG